ncbi:MAG: hypothetical protein ABR910_11260 [Acidobacteriaceae bacterium]
MKWFGLCVLLAVLPLGAAGQAVLRAAAVPPPVTEVLSPGSAAAAPSVKADPRRTFRDPVYKVAFDFPSSWNFTKRDGEISTFRLDARSAPGRAVVRAVVSIPENPFPASTFSGAYVYFSVTPRSSAGSCTKQAAGEAEVAGKAPTVEKPAEIQIAGIPFSHGHDEQKDICITQRDETYTTYRRGACYRFDLAMNNFCGGEVSGVKDVTAKELDEVRGRLMTILGTVRFEAK